MLDGTVRTLLDEFAASKPLPAGVAAAVVAGASGAALALKVVRLSMKKAHGESARTLGSASEQLRQVVHDLPPLFDEDCRAFERVLAARRKKPPDRAATTAAWIGATEVPIRAARLARDGLLALRTAVGGIRAAVRCDGLAAASLLRTAAEISTTTAVSNAASIPGEGANLATAARDALQDAFAAYEAVRATLGG